MATAAIIAAGIDTCLFSIERTLYSCEEWTSSCLARSGRPRAAMKILRTVQSTHRKAGDSVITRSNNWLNQAAVRGCKRIRPRIKRICGCGGSNCTRAENKRARGNGSRFSAHTDNIKWRAMALLHAIALYTASQPISTWSASGGKFGAERSCSGCQKWIGETLLLILQSAKCYLHCSTDRMSRHTSCKHSELFSSTVDTSDTSQLL